MTHTTKTGVLLINTGTTSAPTAKATRVYLREFLSDPRVLDIPAIPRWLLLNLVILPFRPRASAHAYSAVWTERGSPLLVFSQDLEEALAQAAPEFIFATAMRYGHPSIEEGLNQLLDAGAGRVIVAPLFPQYASATTGSVLERVFAVAGARQNVPPLTVLPPFYADDGFIQSWVELARPHLEEFQPEYVLCSYHGLPVRQIRKSDQSGRHCLVSPDCCAAITDINRYCYRAQCAATTRALAKALNWDDNRIGLSFQSRLGRDAWLEPATDQLLAALPKQGVKRLAVLCPAFTADCLETLEEIGMRGKETFLTHGGEAYRLLPCLNSHPAWVRALLDLIRRC